MLGLLKELLIFSISTGENGDFLLAFCLSIIVCFELHKYKRACNKSLSSIFVISLIYENVSSS